MRKTLIGILACSVILSTIGNFRVYATQNDLSSNISISKKQQDNNKKDRKGLLGYYYKEKNFKDLVLFTPTQSGNLSYDQNNVDQLIKKSNQKFASVRWFGLIDTNEDGTYKFKCSDDKNMIIKINGDIVSNLGNNKKEINLKKNTPVFIEINYQTTSDKAFNNDTFKNMNIFKINNKEESIKIKQDDLLSPDNSESLSKKYISLPSKKRSVSNGKYNTDTDDDSIDTDGDSIPDLWEENGYTIQRKVSVKWEDEFAQKGYVKYLSNPYQAHTAGDPYTDYEKAAKDIPTSNAAATHNPLVPAFPSINVDMRKMILSKDSNLSNSAESHCYNNYTYANSEGISIETGWGGFLTGPTMGVNVNYQHTETVGADWGNSTTNTEQFNTASAGYLNANVHYNNVGTGAIYDVQPTTSFILQDSTIATITSKSNATALSIGSGERYPKSKEGIALNTMDDFNSHPITLNKPQLDALLNNEVIKINTDQTDGNYGIIDSNGNAKMGDKWSPVIDQVKGRTASIIIDPDDGKALETRIASKNYNDPEDKTPSVTIKEGLKMAYPEAISEDEDGILFYEYTNNEGKTIKKQLSEASVITYMDEATSKEFNIQLSDGSAKDLYDIKLTPKMNITLKLPVLTFNFDHPSDDYSKECLISEKDKETCSNFIPCEERPGECKNWHIGEICKKLESGQCTKWSDDGYLKPGSLQIDNSVKFRFPKDMTEANYNYLITGYVKYNSNSINMGINDNFNFILNDKDKSSSNKYEKFIVQGKTNDRKEMFNYFTVKGPNLMNGTWCRIDDISIFPLGPANFK